MFFKARRRPGSSPQSKWAGSARRNLMHLPRFPFMKIGCSILLTGLVFCVSPALRAQTQTLPQPATQAPAASPSSPNAYTLAPAKLAKAIAVTRIRNIMDFVGALWGIVLLWLLLATRAAARLEAWAQRVSFRRWIQGLAFFAAIFVIVFLAGLPLDAFSQHVERSYDISVQTWASWLGDQGKSLVLTLLVGAPVLLFFNWIVRRWPRRYWFALWIASLPLLVVSTFAVPLVAPIYNKFEPLQLNHAVLVVKLESVVARTGIRIPPNRMYLMKASDKFTGINAYVAGLGATKQYVMWDTAINQLPDDEILFVFGHESGHYVLHHIPKMIAGAAVGLFFLSWACAACAAWLARRFSARWHIAQVDNNLLASRSGFLVLLFTVSIAGFVLQPVGNGFSRYFEHQADVYGQEAIHGLVPNPQKTAVSEFNHLGESWLEDPNPNPFIEFWESDHPSIKNRANFAEHYDPWANGGHGQFFDK
jgi:Zn-dependent protease with chaperone function